MRQQDKLVHENADGSGIGKHMLQMMEHFVKITKKHCRCHCNHKTGWMKRLMKYIDCVTIGSVGYDLVDFKNCKKEFQQQHDLIYHPQRTPELEADFIRQMPPNFYKYWKMIHKIKFGDKIDQKIIDLWNQHLKHKYNQIECERKFSSYIESYDSESSYDNNRRKLHKKEVLEEMQKQTQSQMQTNDNDFNDNNSFNY